MMKAILLAKHGGPEVLQMTEVRLPEPKRGEVRVKIAFIGINFAEVLSRRGVYGWAPKLQYIPGMEAAGTVDAIGPDVAGIAEGTPVIVGTQHGTYAEFICIPPAAFSPPRAITRRKKARPSRSTT